MRLGKYHNLMDYETGGAKSVKVGVAPDVAFCQRFQTQTLLVCYDRISMAHLGYIRLCQYVLWQKKDLI